MTALLLATAKGSPLNVAEADGNLTELERRTGPGWRDYPCDIVIPTGALDAPSWVEFEDGFSLPAFPHGSTTSCLAFIHLDHDYKAGTMVYPHIHWTQNVNVSGVVRFGVTWKYARRDDAASGVRVFTAAQTVYIEHSVVSNEYGSHQVSESPEGFGIYHADFDVDGIIMCKFFRDGTHINDTFTGQALLIKADAHAQVDQNCTPLRTPPFY